MVANITNLVASVPSSLTEIKDSLISSSLAISLYENKERLISQETLGIALVGGVLGAATYSLLGKVYKNIREPSNLAFKDFILQAQQTPPNGVLLVRNGHVTTEVDWREDQAELNQRTWAAFIRAVKKAFPTERLAYICKRYELDLAEMRRRKTPLTSRHVEYFGVGALNPKEKDINQARGWLARLFKRLDRCSVGEIAELYGKVTRYGFLRNPLAPEMVKGGPSDGHQQLRQDPFKADQKRSMLYAGMANLRSTDQEVPSEHPALCRLTMATINCLETHIKNQDTGLVFPVPGRTEGALDFYKVHKIISCGGLTAIALVPLSADSHLQPTVLFRCTEQALSRADAISSLLNDLEEEIGNSGYQAAKEALAALMKDKTFTRGKRFRVCAYSLGGAHATYFMRDHWKNVSEFIGFNITGCTAHVVEDLAQQINAAAPFQIPPFFYLYRNVCSESGEDGDWVNNVGQKHIGWGIARSVVTVIETLITKTRLAGFGLAHMGDWLDIHSTRTLDDKEPFQRAFRKGPLECDRILNTNERKGSLEEIRLRLGHGIVYKVITVMYSVLDFIFRLIGIDFFKKNTL